MKIYRGEIRTYGGAGRTCGGAGRNSPSSLLLEADSPCIRSFQTGTQL